MLGGSGCKLGGRKLKSGGSTCSDRLMTGGKKKSSKTKKTAKRGNKRKKGGGDSSCVGAPFATVFETPLVEDANVPTVDSGMVGGAKRKKAKKTKKSRKAGPYAKFVKKHFASVAKKNPSWKATDCMKQIAKMWKAQKK